jgi:hypothetical protein
MNLTILIFLTGILATIFMDLWGIFVNQAFGVKGLDYRFVGRWAGYCLKGTLYHVNIFNKKPLRFEVVVGWGIHYSIGVFFTAVLIFFCGRDWFQYPTFKSALSIGLITTLAPFLILQPAFGLGIAGAKTPSPNITRLKSVMAHTSYGVGLYLAGLLISALDLY